MAFLISDFSVNVMHLMLCMGGLLSYVGDLMLNRLVNGSTNKSGWIHGVK